MGEFISFFIFIFVISWLGVYAKVLSNSGGIAAFGVGIAVALGFGVRGLLILGVFFASSSLWSIYKKNQKKQVEEKLEKGSVRDWQQVLANGGAAASLSFLYFVDPQPIFLLGFLIAIASANADTWASEIGVLSKKRPILIRTLQRVDRGTSGAVSLLGSFSALIGSGLIAFIGLYIFHLSIKEVIFIFIFGWLGNALDTIIGAYWQISYRCPYCQLETEKRHHCNRQTIKIKGNSVMNNDFVNFLSSFIAVVIGISVFLILS